MEGCDIMSLISISPTKEEKELIKIYNSSKEKY
jgi:hypothetical protein